MTLYEGFFLFDSAEANRNYSGLTEEVEGLMKKYGAEIVRSAKWGERKLAYEINGVKRGTYLLYYFTMDSLKVGELRRDFQLSDKLLRHMIIREERTVEDIEALPGITEDHTTSELASKSASDIEKEKKEKAEKEAEEAAAKAAAEAEGEAAEEAGDESEEEKEDKDTAKAKDDSDDDSDDSGDDSGDDSEEESEEEEKEGVSSS